MTTILSQPDEALRQVLEHAAQLAEQVARQQQVLDAQSRQDRVDAAASAGGGQ